MPPSMEGPINGNKDTDNTDDDEMPRPCLSKDNGIGTLMGVHILCSLKHLICVPVASTENGAFNWCLKKCS